MEKKIKKILLLIIVVGLFLPLVQYHFNIVNIKGLHGSFQKKKLPAFSVKDWFNNNFQNQYDNYYNEKFGFRSSFVRLHNQIEYSAFNEVHANSVVVGKEEYLFERQYIKSYLGEDYIGQQIINAKVKTIDSIYQILKQHQTELLIILAPGKGYFYPEYIPDSMIKERGLTNYDGYVKAIKEHGIPYIDFNDLFLKMKDTVSIVIYPKTGIHWSQGILPYVMDSIINKIEPQIDQDLPNVICKYSKPVKRADKQDADIEKGLNLIFPLSTPKMSYPTTSFENNKSLDRPKVISIADSFWWQIFNKGISKKVFHNGKFWYYYKQVYPDQFKKETLVEYTNVKEELFNADLVILMATDANLYKFPYGFTKALENNKFETLSLEEKISNQIESLKDDGERFQKVKEKANFHGISVDSMLYLDAIYILNRKEKKAETKK